MKIGIDGRLWNETGVGRYTRNLVKNLVEIDSKNEFVLFVLKKDVSSIKYYVSSKNLKIIEADIHWHSFKEQFRFSEVLYKENLDLMHFPYFSVPVFYSKPFVVTIHDLIINHFPTGKASTLPLPYYYFKLFAYKQVIKNAVLKSKKIITVSEATKQEILDHYKVSSNKIVVTYEGVDLATSSREKKKTDGSMREASGYFLYVGNAYPHKNLDLLISAFNELKTHDSKLILVGKEDYFYKKLKEKVKELGLTDRVEFKGYVSDQELGNLYQNAKATIIPSLMEGFSLPGLEAMSQGSLVIASDIPVHREIFSDAAIYFDPYSGESLKDVLSSVYSNDIYHYSELVKKGKKRVKDFSWKKMVEETQRIYLHFNLEG